MKTSTSLLPDADSARGKEHPSSTGHSAGSVEYKNDANRRVGVSPEKKDYAERWSRYCVTFS